MSSNNKFRFEVAKLQLKPGDLLAVRFPASEEMNNAQIQKIMEGLRNLLPKGCGVTWFKGDVQVSVITPADQGEGEDLAGLAERVLAIEQMFQWHPDPYPLSKQTEPLMTLYDSAVRFWDDIPNLREQGYLRIDAPDNAQTNQEP